jgi:hypothetical protein
LEKDKWLMAHYGALPLAAFMVKLGSVFGSGGGVWVLQIEVENSMLRIFGMFSPRARIEFACSSRGQLYWVLETVVPSPSASVFPVLV